MIALMPSPRSGWSMLAIPGNLTHRSLTKPNLRSTSNCSNCHCPPLRPTCEIAHDLVHPCIWLPKAPKAGRGGLGGQGSPAGYSATIAPIGEGHRVRLGGPGFLLGAALTLLEPHKCSSVQVFNYIVAKIENKCDSDVWKYKLLYYFVVSECMYVCFVFVCVHQVWCGVVW